MLGGVRARIREEARESAVLTPDRVAAPRRAQLLLPAFRMPAGSSSPYSGGSDSDRVLRLIHSSSPRRGAAGRLLAVTVDHGLRAGSAEEARRVGATCAALGIAHAMPAGRAKARKRRAGRRTGRRATGCWQTPRTAVMVLTGHTLDDQRRRWRCARGAGRRRADLSGIAPATLYERCTWSCGRCSLGAEELRDVAGNGRAGLDRGSVQSGPALRTRPGQARRRRGSSPGCHGTRRRSRARRDEAEAAAALLRGAEAWQFDAEGRTADIALRCREAERFCAGARGDVRAGPRRGGEPRF